MTHSAPAPLPALLAGSPALYSGIYNAVITGHYQHIYWHKRKEMATYKVNSKSVSKEMNKYKVIIISSPAISFKLLGYCNCKQTW